MTLQEMGRDQSTYSESIVFNEYLAGLRVNVLLRKKGGKGERKRREGQGKEERGKGTGKGASP